MLPLKFKMLGGKRYIDVLVAGRTLFRDLRAMGLREDSLVLLWQCPSGI